MLTGTVPIPRESEDETSQVSVLLDAAGQADLSLPCRTNNPDLWFADTPTELEQAKDLCASCPIKAACLAAALTRREPWGVWGGEIFERGTVIAKKRPRGRPRKDATITLKETAA
ncbi:WhiB family transcriptional regulator [Pseudonocardiaceae bacterium YIM PH 21723]|nr:WhiB family transcriptional regulator [Pseudonocardiaceae bacterium YIM PH 21723]